MNKNFRQKGNKPFFKNRGKFQNRRDNVSRGPAEDSIVESIGKGHIDKRLILRGIIDQIEQTGGPTILYLADGTGTLALKAFNGAGVRAHPDINVGDAVNATVKIQEYNDEIEGEVESLVKLGEEENKALAKKIDEMQKEKAKVKHAGFLVQDKILEKLKDRFVAAAGEIRLAILKNRPIVVRHHSDTDGYSSGYALERAILPLIVKQHSSVKSAWEFYVRSPVHAPMYEMEDSIRDTAHSLSNAAKFSNKMPLVIIVDTGSGEKDLLGIQQGRVHGLDFIVVDHHAFDEDVISKETMVHINPFLVGEDGAKFSAGMLCTELARFINDDPNLNILQIPAMAGLADRTNNPEAIEGYLKIAEKQGYNKKILWEISLVIDFVSAKLRFMEAREYIEVLFGEPMAKQKALVALLGPYINKLDAKGLAVAKEAAEIKKIGKISVQFLDVENNFARGVYPKPGKCVSMLHDYAYEEKKMEKLVTFGMMMDSLIIRASAEANFSVHELMEHLEKSVPKAFVEGGGHKQAGSIRFVPSRKKEVIKAVEDYISKIK